MAYFKERKFRGSRFLTLSVNVYLRKILSSARRILY